MQDGIGRLTQSISPNSKYKLAEAAHLVSPVIPVYLFYSILRVKRRAVKRRTIGGLSSDLTGAELLDIVKEAKNQIQAKNQKEVSLEPHQAPRALRRTDPPAADLGKVLKDPQAPMAQPTTVLQAEEFKSDAGGPPWARKIIERLREPHGYSPSTLEYLGRFPKVFAQLPDDSWYIRRHDQVAVPVRPSEGMSYIWHLLSSDKALETRELIGADTRHWPSDEDGPYATFGTFGWRVTELFDEERVYDKVCKRFERAIAAIGKANAELGRYFQLVIQLPSENGEGWLIQNHEPGEWTLAAEFAGADAAMHKLGDWWLLRWGETECRIPNDRIGIEYVARILDWPDTGVPCCLLRDAQLAHALSSGPDIRASVPIIRKHIRRKDCLAKNIHESNAPGAVLVRLTAVLDRKGAEALLDGRTSDAAEITSASANLKTALECRKTRERLILTLDALNLQGRTQVKKNLDSALQFLSHNGAAQMAEHLAQHIETGEVCFYSGSLNWDIQGLRPFPCIFHLAAERVFGVDSIGIQSIAG